MQRLTHIWKCFRDSQRGTAFVEFALTLPLLLMLFMGSVELTRYILITQKIEKVSMTLSDLVAQSQTISSAQLAQIITATGQVLQPYTFGANSYAIITSVTKTGTAAPKVNWQYTGGGTWTHASAIGIVGANATLPSGFTMSDKDNVIFAEVFYNFTPLMSQHLVPAKSIYRVSVFKPRLGDLSTLSALMPVFLKGTFV